MDTNHRLIDAFSMMPWAVEEETYLLIQDILYNKEKYIKLAEDRQKAEEQQSQDGNADEPQLLPYVKVHGPVSVMQMHGVMSRRMNLMMALSGGVTRFLLVVRRKGSLPLQMEWLLPPRIGWEAKPLNSTLPSLVTWGVSAFFVSM